MNSGRPFVCREAASQTGAAEEQGRPKRAAPQNSAFLPHQLYPPCPPLAYLLNPPCAFAAPAAVPAAGATLMSRQTLGTVLARMLPEHS